MELLFKRHNGTFVALVNGNPYHVIPDDPMFPDAQDTAAQMGDKLQLEPPPHFSNPDQPKV